LTLVPADKAGSNTTKKKLAKLLKNLGKLGWVFLRLWFFDNWIIHDKHDCFKSEAV